MIENRPSKHNDLVLGFPIAFATSATVLVDSLDKLIHAGALGEHVRNCYQVKIFPAVVLHERASAAPFIPEGLKGCFEVFSQGETPTYLLWRVNHSDVDAMSVLSFLEQLRASVTSQPPRWLTPRDLLNSEIAVFRHVDWVDTDGEPLYLPVANESPKEISVHLAAALTVAFGRRTGRSNVRVGFLFSGRSGDKPVVAGNKLTIATANCVIDIGDAHKLPQTVLADTRNLLIDLFDRDKGQNITSAETVDILINTQTLNWYGAGCAILGNSTPTFQTPIIYHQIVDHLSQIRADVEFWDRDHPRIRFRNSHQHSKIMKDIISDAMELCAGLRSSLDICSGETRTFDPLNRYVESFLRGSQSSVCDRVEELRLKFQEIDENYAIGIVKEGSVDTFLYVVACILSGRVCHFLGDTLSSQVDIEEAAQRLGVPVAVELGNEVRYIRPKFAGRSVARDAQEGWAYIVSSGSTGAPKVTLLTFSMSENIIGNACKYLNIDERSRILMLASPMFDAIYFECLIALLAPTLPCVYGHLSEYIEHQDGIADVDGCTHLVATPTVLSLLTSKNILLPRTIMSVGERLSDDLLKSLTNQGSHVLDLYGPSEAGIWSGIRDASRHERGFRPIDNVYFRPSAKIDSGRYSFNIGLSARIYGSRALEVSSGDSAIFQLEDNYIDDVSRSDGLIKIGGRRIPIVQIFDALLIKSGFRATSIVQIDSDDEYGVQAFAAVMIVNSHSEETVDFTSLFGARFALFRVFDPARTQSGKLDVASLLQRFNVGLVSQLPDASSVGLADQIARVWMNYTGTDEATVQFSEIGGCSLDALRIQIELSREGIHVPLPSASTTLASLVHSAERRNPLV